MAKQGAEPGSLDFSPGLFPVKSLQGSKHHSLPGFSPICDPTLTFPTPAVPNSHLLTPNPQSSVPAPSSLRKVSLHVLPSQPPTHPIPSFCSIQRYGAPTPLLPPKLYPPLPRPHPSPAPEPARPGGPAPRCPPPTSLGGCTHTPAPLTGKAA